MNGEKGKELGGTAGLWLGASVSFVVVTAVLCGGTWFWNSYKARQAQRGWNLQPVLVAARPLAEGHVLAGGDVRTGKLPEQFVTDTLAPVATAWQGKPVVQDLLENEPLRKTDLGPRSCASTIAAHWSQAQVGLTAKPPQENGGEDPQVEAVLSALQKEEAR